MSTDVRVYRLHDEETGPFLGYGTLVSQTLVFLQPPANRAIAEEHIEGLRLRCQIIEEPDKVTVYDGTVRYPEQPLPGPPIGVDLDYLSDAPIETVPGTDADTAEEIARALDDFLQAAAGSHASKMPSRAPVRADPGESPPISDEPDQDEEPPGPSPRRRRPWYCVICPHAVGC